MATPPDRKSQEIRMARVGRRPPRLAVTLVALAVVFAVAWVFFVRTGPATPTPTIEAVQGTYTWRSTSSAGHLPSEDGTFSAAASGDAGGGAKFTYDSEVLGTPVTAVHSAYDADLRRRLTVYARPAGSGVAEVVGGWPPAWSVTTRSPLDYQGLAAIVRTAVEDRDMSVGTKPLKDGDRKVWRAAMLLDGKNIEVVVDQLTGIVTWCTDGSGTFTAVVDWDAPPPAGETYVVDVPGDARTVRETHTTIDYAPSPAAAGRTAGYDPLVSDLAPDGFSLEAVATTEVGLPDAWLVGAYDRRIDPSSSQTEVAECYTRGLSQFTVRQLGPRAARAWGAGLRDTTQSFASEKLSFEQTTLQYGALTGATAYTWYETTGPTLFVSDDRHVVHVTGALTRQELISFAEGLKPVGSGEAASSAPSPSSSSSP